jgi:hypothetical protein
MKDFEVNVVENGSNTDYSDYDVTDNEVKEGIEAVLQDIKEILKMAIANNEKIEIRINHYKY